MYVFGFRDDEEDDDSEEAAHFLSLWPLLLALALVFMMNVELLTLARGRMTAKGPS